ncbi:hypothetical protein ASPCADRAFT_410616, partial [Aspergillus carbonarius ITEM 5010]
LEKKPIRRRRQAHSVSGSDRLHGVTDRLLGLCPCLETLRRWGPSSGSLTASDGVLEVPSQAAPSSSSFSYSLTWTGALTSEAELDLPDRTEIQRRYEYYYVEDEGTKPTIASYGVPCPPSRVNDLIALYGALLILSQAAGVVSTEDGATR